MPRAAQFVAPLFLLLGPPLTLVHGTEHLTAYFVESGIICGLALASWALYRPTPHSIHRASHDHVREVDSMWNLCGWSGVLRPASC
jgi:hypothetical protein